MSREVRVEQVSRLQGAALRRKQYRRYSPEWDHDHCAACWATFVEKVPDALHSGYATIAEYEHGEDYEWVCPTCFDELREAMSWRLVE